MTQSINNFIYKCLIVGDSESGKTTFLKRHLTNEFHENILPTSGVRLHSLAFHSNHGQILFNIWDTAGTEQFIALGDNYYNHGQCAIIMFDITQNDKTYENVQNWYKDLNGIYGDIPMVICANKIDNMENSNEFQWNEFPLMMGEKNLEFMEISVKTGLNIEKPFIWLASKLMNQTDLKFQNEPMRVLSEILDKDLQQEINDELDSILEMDYHRRF